MLTLTLAPEDYQSAVPIDFAAVQLSPTAYEAWIMTVAHAIVRLKARGTPPDLRHLSDPTAQILPSGKLYLSMNIPGIGRLSQVVPADQWRHRPAFPSSAS